MIHYQSLPIRAKFHWTVGKLLPDQKKFHRKVGGQWPILTLCDKKKRQKNKTDQKNNLIVGQMWLGILSDLPLFYQTCPVDPTLLGKTAIHPAIRTTFGQSCVTYIQSQYFSVVRVKRCFNVGQRYRRCPDQNRLNIWCWQEYNLYQSGCDFKTHQEV